jgi:hypothetical protein
MKTRSISTTLLVRQDRPHVAARSVELGQLLAQQCKQQADAKRKRPPRHQPRQLWRGRVNGITGLGA